MESRRLHIFKSFEEMEDAHYLELSRMDPIERLGKAVELILRVYGVTREELKMRERSNRIIITRRG